MKKFTVTGPDGKLYDAQGPDNATQEQAEQQFRLQQNIPSNQSAKPDPIGPKADPDLGGRKSSEVSPSFGGTRAPESENLIGGSRALSAAAGVGYGAFVDPLVGLGQLAERATGHHMAPEFIRQGVKRLRDAIEGSTYGKIGETVGQVGGMVLAPEVLAGTRVVSGLGRLADAVGIGTARAARLTRAAEGARAVGDEATAAARTAEITERQSARAGEGIQNVFRQPRSLPAVRGPGGRMMTNPGEAARAGREAVTRRVIGGAAVGAASPVDDKDPDFWLTKAEQIGGGAASGIIGGTERGRQALNLGARLGTGYGVGEALFPGHGAIGALTSVATFHPWAAHNVAVRMLDHIIAHAEEPWAQRMVADMLAQTESYVGQVQGDVKSRVGPDPLGRELQRERDKNR